MEMDNPWLVTKWEEFLYFCCPECDEKSQSKEDFVNHALSVHPMAKVCLETIEVVQTSSSSSKTKENKNHFVEENFNYTKTEYPCSSFEENITVKKEHADDVTDSLTPQVIIKTEEITNNDRNDNENIEYKDEMDTEIYDDDFDLSEQEEEEEPSNLKNECKICKKTFKNKNCVKIHVRKVHEAQKLQCHLCQVTLRDAGGLRRHIKHVHDKVERKFGKCDLCDKVFRSSGYLKIHMQAVHEKVRKWNCELCAKDFAHKEGYLSHHRTIHEGKKMQCDLCGETFTQRVALKSHKIRKHEEEINALYEGEGGKFPCTMCEKIFNTSELLKDHLSVIHKKIGVSHKTSQKSWTCDRCGKNLSSSSMLKKHILFVHEGQKNVECDVCKRAFSQEYNLRLHMKNMHTEADERELHTCDKW